MKTFHVIDPRVLLSTLWTIILFNTIVKDLHEFLRPGYIEQLMSYHIPQETILLYGVIAQIPIFMILMPRILKDRTNKWYNTIAALITSLGLLSTLPTADMDNILFVLVQNLLLIIILRVSWRLTKDDAHSKSVKTWK